MSTIDTFTVAGMSCEHCVASVREEVSELPGVHAAEVDLASGRLVIAGSGVSSDAVRAAVADAGYELVD
jgi:copper chaperone CopZ